MIISELLGLLILHMLSLEFECPNRCGLYCIWIRRLELKVLILVYPGKKITMRETGHWYSIEGYNICLVLETNFVLDCYLPQWKTSMSRSLRNVCATQYYVSYSPDVIHPVYFPRLDAPQMLMRRSSARQ
ncbi:hypothetical protein F4604DRAFT_1759342 [Suillus subluteus]|nr:hypothetical protein F4604DRAFT_1759342 [Suillus subluteus]